ncbi:DUF350 domain-containing protein [Planctomyces sp. SH-PL14]|jgi:uncharacterized membrane protein YjfL (UPF0719 family)|uniref:DUF350 domain-containing protein n=1 Tax=Planctomyces sp. SH-PL14 TaxID=1632864 RepID=UPI00078B915E|nr:DUF350 domain-containing protein [Planctomyces sp. SH-PL14]AMV20607.1 hypothetical protein VT03_22095 [Planctomyces sp. SH-PL14]
MWDSVLIASLFGLVGILLSVIGYKLFDLIETKIDFAEEIKKGNTAAAIVIAGFLLGICFIIGRAIGS